MNKLLYRRIINWFQYNWHYWHFNCSKNRLKRLESVEQLHRWQTAKLKDLDHMLTVHMEHCGKMFRHEIGQLNERFKATDAATDSVRTMMENLINNFSKPQAKPKVKRKKAIK